MAGLILKDIVQRFGDAYRAQTLDFVQRVREEQEAAVDAYDARAALAAAEGIAARHPAMAFRRSGVPVSVPSSKT